MVKAIVFPQKEAQASAEGTEVPWATCTDVNSVKYML